jgi:hypothetical protein
MAEEITKLGCGVSINGHDSYQDDLSDCMLSSELRRWTEDIMALWTPELCCSSLWTLGKWNTFP